MTNHSEHVPGVVRVPKGVTMWSTGIYTKSYRDDGTVLDDKELMACGECGAVVTFDHSTSHVTSNHAQARGD